MVDFGQLHAWEPILASPAAADRYGSAQSRNKFT